MYEVSAWSGSGPIHRDVLKIIILFAQNLRRHFFVRKRERYYTLRLAHVFGCYKLDLPVREMFCLGMVSTNLFRFFYVGGIQNSNCAGKDKVFFLTSG